MTEGDFDLEPLSEEEYNEQGSFSFPPPPRSLGQVVRFWRSVQISDNVLLRMSREYERHQYGLREQAVREHGQANPEPSQMRGHRINPDYETWIAGQNNAEAEVDAEHPRSIPPHWARGLARATMLMKQAIDLDLDLVDLEDDRVYEYQVGGGPSGQRVLLSYIDVGSRGQMRVSDALETFRTMDLDGDVWFDQSARDIALIAEAVASHLAEGE
ncbi:hypothetical protein [Sanguibacter sp. Leaf3]|uniref:hypothetical protein n=1 Tax=Sanguibacter sp. Leaf3 TaxID=1736209 RepID=UPI000B09E8C8|nr:hypothetical protein [Sanguibacter sp. Leaf3]